MASSLQKHFQRKIADNEDDEDLEQEEPTQPIQPAFIEGMKRILFYCLNLHIEKVDYRSEEELETQQNPQTSINNSIKFIFLIKNSGKTR